MERLIEYRGETHNLAQWSRITGIGITTLCGRLKKGWKPERILSKENCLKDASGANEEEWRAVVGYEGLYEVSRNGLIRSISYGKKAFFLHPTTGKRTQRDSVMLTKERERKRVSVHRIVAMAFVENPNPEKYTEVNHKDENPLNNKAENLEWCDRSYNMHYNNLPARITRHKKEVIGTDEEGNEIRFESTQEAKRNGYEPSGIYGSIHKPLKNGARRKYKGLYWRYGKCQ